MTHDYTGGTAPKGKNKTGAALTHDAPEGLADCYEWLRSWREDVFTLFLYDTKRMDHHGKSVLAYELYDREYRPEPVFRGEDFTCSPCHVIDSDHTVLSLLHFLSLEAEDTDAEYFEAYTPEQITWRNERAYLLKYCVCELEQTLGNGGE